MAISRTGTYNQGATAVVLDGTSLTDMGDDFAYRITLPDTATSLTKGTQRAVTNFTTDKTATLDLSLLPESASNDLIAAMYYGQQRGRGREFDVTIHTAESTIETCNGCSIRQGGAIEGGGPAGVSRVYILNVKEYIPPLA